MSQEQTGTVGVLSNEWNPLMKEDVAEKLKSHIPDSNQSVLKLYVAEQLPVLRDY